MGRYQFTEQELSIFEGLRQPFAVYQFVDRRVVTLALSEGFCKLFGYENNRALAYRDMDQDMYRDTHPDDAARIADAAIRFATEGGAYEVIYRSRIKDSADYRVIHAFGQHVYTDTGVRLAHVWYADEGVYADGVDAVGSELRQSLSNALHEQSLLNASRYDFLTGLPSMSYFFELAEAGKTAIFREGGNAALLYIDLNGMKYFNHKYGFVEGDKLLRAFAKLLSGTFSNENCCHVGADHFAAYTNEDGLEDTLRELFRKTRDINGGVSLPIRVGIYSTRLEDSPVSTACDRAKLACDSLRGAYESAFHYFSREMSLAVQNRQYILSNLDRALAENWVQVYYQPIVRATTEKVCDEEALARWIDPVNGLMSPAEFIPALEDAGLIYKLDLYVLDQVLDKIKRQEKTGLYVVPHSVNLSRVDFDACDIVEEIRKRVDAAGVSRGKITIEITESTIGRNFEFMKEQVLRFQELGFPVWMDDFGSGYSSMDVLRSIRFDLIKFDMSLLRKLDEDDSGKVILTELMKMATSLGLDTVCEGVETESQVLFLQEIGCSKLQGFFFGRPSSLEQIRQRYDHGLRLGFEDPAASSYYESIGRISLYDLDVIAAGNEDPLQNAFNTLPMAILEIRGDTVRYLRTNPSYRRFINRFFDFDLSMLPKDYVRFASPFMMNIVTTCSKPGARAFFNEKMGDGSVVHSFARWIALNPASGDIAVAVAVLSVSDPGLEESYADIARALAADYYNIYVVDLDTEDFIEYSSPVGGDTLSVERHGAGFFESVRRDTMTRIYEDDRKLFLTRFNKENVMKELAVQGLFTTTYRLIDSGEPVYAALKVTRMRGTNKIILGVSIIDSQMKQQEQMRTD